MTNEIICTTNITPDGSANIPATEGVSTVDTTLETPDVSADLPGETTLNTEIKMDFEPNDFVEELPTMGKGMLGIFIVIGIIIGATCLLNFIFKPRNK